MIRRHGDAPLTSKRYTRRPGVYAILYRDGAVLTTYQAMPHDEVQLPGGGIDAGESPIAALHREVFEETGWHMASPRHFGTFRRFTYMPEYDLWAEKLCSVFVARPTLQIGPPLEPSHSVLWVPVAEAADHLGNPGDRAIMARFARLQQKLLR